MRHSIYQAPALRDIYGLENELVRRAARHAWHASGASLERGLFRWKINLEEDIGVDSENGSQDWIPKIAITELFGHRYNLHGKMPLFRKMDITPKLQV